MENFNYREILIEGARANNLKNITLSIPKRKITVVTGLSGSGKTSLAFDTIYAEGQRKYVESLSAYARQFLGKIMKPDVDKITGLSPAIAIRQFSTNVNPRSTVGTITEIYDYLKILYTRIGKTYSPISGREVKHYKVEDVVEYVMSFPDKSRFFIVAPYIEMVGRDVEEQLGLWHINGYSRVLLDNNIYLIRDLLNDNNKLTKISSDKLFLLVDRLTKSDDEDFAFRIKDSIQSAFFEGDGKIFIVILSGKERKWVEFSNKFELDGMRFSIPDVNFFSYTSPYGACPVCEGYGTVVDIAEHLVIPDPTLSIYEGAVAPWRGEKMSEWQKYFIKYSKKYNFPIHKPYKDLTEEEKNLLWNGRDDLEGINSFFKMLQENTYKIQYRVMLSRYREKTICKACKGTRLRKETQYVKIHGYSLPDLLMMQIDQVRDIINTWVITEKEREKVKYVIKELNSRIDYLIQVGLPYVTLNRGMNTLSGGEIQRVYLSRALGSTMTDTLYVLDEPTVGLHPRDTHKLIDILKKLSKAGNTIIVVEHDKDIIKASDWIVDLGPKAGSEGGNVVFSGPIDQLSGDPNSFTAKYLYDPLPAIDSKTKFSFLETNNRYIELKGANKNNLKNINIRFPLNQLIAIVGVSGSGKSTLVVDELYEEFNKYLQHFDFEKTKLSGDFKLIKDIVLIDQSSISRSTRSNPITFLKIFDYIRELYSLMPLSIQRGYKPSTFSFNTTGGRCETCKGDGYIIIEMQFMADVKITCEDCHGKRFKEDVLEVTFGQKNIYDILQMTIDDAYEFFKSQYSFSKNKKIANLITQTLNGLELLKKVGLGYLKMGQSTDTLSGGEAQRLKLASYIGAGEKTEKTLFLFDEPTTGLHYYDVDMLYKSFKELIMKGHTICFIEHNIELIKRADWVIELGPDGGEQGGYLIFEGTIEDFIKTDTITTKYLKD
ncbi:MAG: excinuclease ABC subunit UvrA [Bacteroidales bacterium]|nr:excinuclease ABC subunit UvrA [Bacteroidales bacterium]MDY0400885.1 excinuclease ABC subunit UvrA [Bacteroidales bacterium]